MKKIEIRDSIARPSVARPFPVRDGLCQKTGLLMAFFTIKQRAGDRFGLSLSYDKISNGLGGVIDFKSKEESGTLFRIFLPVNK